MKVLWSALSLALVAVLAALLWAVASDPGRVEVVRDGVSVGTEPSSTPAPGPTGDVRRGEDGGPSSSPAPSGTAAEDPGDPAPEQSAPPAPAEPAPAPRPRVDPVPPQQVPVPVQPAPPVGGDWDDDDDWDD